MDFPEVGITVQSHPDWRTVPLAINILSLQKSGLPWLVQFRKSFLAGVRGLLRPVVSHSSDVLMRKVHCIWSHRLLGTLILSGLQQLRQPLRAGKKSINVCIVSMGKTLWPVSVAWPRPTREGPLYMVPVATHEPMWMNYSTRFYQVFCMYNMEAASKKQVVKDSWKKKKKKNHRTKWFMISLDKIALQISVHSCSRTLVSLHIPYLFHDKMNSTFWKTWNGSIRKRSFQLCLPHILGKEPVGLEFLKIFKFWIKSVC